MTQAAKRPSQLLRNLSAKIAAIPMVLTASVVFAGGTIWTVVYSFTNSKLLPREKWVGFDQYERLWSTNRWLISIENLMIYGFFSLVFSLVIRAMGQSRDGESKRPPLIPGFVLVFLALATINSFGVIPEVVATALSDVSRWALLVAIAAVGMKTSLRRMLDVGGQAIVLIVGETLFIAAFILIGIKLLA